MAILEAGGRTASGPASGVDVRAASSGGTVWGATLGRLAREPLVHFLGLGALLLAGSALLGDPAANARRIVISEAKLDQLRETWTGQWGEPPSSAQLQALVDDYLREEVLFREAVAFGLDRDDTIIRRHLAQKLDFVAQGEAAALEMREADVQRYFSEHQQQYATPSKVAFEHVYFSASRRGDSAVAAANATLPRLKAGLTRTALDALGDPFMLRSAFAPQSREQVRDGFGPEFAAQLFALPLNQWVGPVRSSFGEHLVRVTEALPERTPPLDDVREQVLLDLSDQRSRAAADAYYAKVRARYAVAFEVPVEAVGR